jgi:hypothetical protein
MVVSLRVVVVYLLPSFPDLLDDEELAFGHDDPLNLRLLVPREDDEVVALTDDGGIALVRKLDRLQAGRAAALAMERQGSRDAVPLPALFDPLVHIAEGFLVSRRAFSEVHR